MRIGYDGLTITSRPAGVGGSARGILHGLAALGGDEIVAAVPRASAARPVPAGEVRFLDAPIDIPDTPRALLYQHVTMPRLLRAESIDVHVAPAFVLPWRRTGAPEIVVVYDTSWRRFPESKSRQFRAYMDRVVPASMRRARAIVTCSEFSAAECRELAPDAAERVHVVPLGITTRAAAADVDGALSALGIARPFVLSVSNFDPRKNLPRLIDAWRRLRAEQQFPHALVLVGRPDRAAALRSDCAVADDEPLITPGYVTDAQLSALYAATDLVIVPSVYEGFGFPVLEAFAAGAPVACANAGSLPEVAGDAALMFDPFDVDALAAAIDAGVRGSPARDERVARGHEHAAPYTWERTAREMRAILAAVAGR